MKSISASAKYSPEVIKRLFSTADRSRETANKVLIARSSASGMFVSQGLTLTTNKDKSTTVTKKSKQRA